MDEIATSDIAGYANVLRAEFKAAKFKKEKKDEAGAEKKGPNYK